MNRIDETFNRLKNNKEKALVGFVTAGDPDPGTSLEIIDAMCRSGIDILELGVPFQIPQPTARLFSGLLQGPWPTG